MNQVLSTHRMKIALYFSLGFGAIDLLLSVLGGWLAYLLAGTLGAFLTIMVLGLLAGALVIAYAVIMASLEASKMIVAEAQENVEQLIAQREAMERSLNSAQLNLNTGPGNMKVNNKPITYRVKGQVVNGNLLQISAPAPRTIEISAYNVRWFCEQLANGYKHSESAWLDEKIELPHPRTPVTKEIYDLLVSALAEGTAIVGRGDRRSGRLVEKNPAQLVKVIEQKYPHAGSKGIVLEIPAETGKTT